MSDKRDARRDQLRRDLIAAARRRIGRDGLAALRARDLARDVGCSLGAIYNVFEDLPALILAANQRTLIHLNEHLEAGQTAAAADTPTARLVALAHGYCDFAAAHPNHWRALFEHRTPDGGAVPPAFLTARDALFQHIAVPLAEVMPKADSDALALRAKTLFAAVHGVVAFWLEGRFDADGVTEQRVHAELENLIGAYARGS